MAHSTAERSVRLPSGAAMPMLGLGTWQLRGEQGYATVRHALDTGYRHIDTAKVYRNEAEVGRAVKDSGVPREQVFITTKLPPDDAGRERQTIAASLDALGSDYVDLWLVHWPPGDQAGEDTWEQLLAIRQEGLARDVGVSNYSPAQIDRLLDTTGTAPAVNQIKWSPALFDARRLAHSRERGVVLEGYSPFKAGRLDDPALAEIAAAHDVTAAQVVLRWHLEHEVVCIPKSARPERIESNFDVFGFSLSQDEVARIDALSTVG